MSGTWEWREDGAALGSLKQLGRGLRRAQPGWSCLGLHGKEKTAEESSTFRVLLQPKRSTVKQRRVWVAAPIKGNSC